MIFLFLFRVDDIQNYLGEKTGLYFEFLLYYVVWVRNPAIIGHFVYILVYYCILDTFCHRSIFDLDCESYLLDYGKNFE